ncbi:glycosyl transferase GTB-type super family [Candidatus Termititenax aidoneus]|uniref:Glycosyl transferase GTB-type super family n=1 Tax=Termititenax aidoneus TaxID=2218524 RepID=A0A388TE65_TERA1|nr:glycosyl transferase GTB-type super family [Candidatus Termititenax aidoneus]
MKVWSIFYGNLALNQGPTTHFSELTKGLAQAGVNITGYAPALGRYNGPHKDKLRIKYTWTLNIPFIRVVIYDLVLFFRLLFTFPKPDIFYVRAAYFSLFTPVLTKILRKKLVLEINGFVVDDVISKGWPKPLRWISINCEKFLHKIAAVSICVSATIARAVHDTFNVPERKLLALENGVNVEHFRPLDKKTCRAELGFAPDIDYIGYVGCFTGWDGIEHIVRALPEIQKDFPKTKVLLVGDGEQKSFVENEVKKLGLTEEVIFTGYAPYKDLPKYLNVFTVAVAPYGGSDSIQTRNKKGGLSSLKCKEYISSGLPVIVADISGVDYINDLAGFVIPQGDIKALAEKAKLLLGDAALREKFSLAGREYAVKNCSWQNVADRTRAIFENILRT